MSGWNSLEEIRKHKRKQRTLMKRRGLRRINEFYVHEKDFATVARYLDRVNARRFPEGQRPPRLIQPSRPRGGVTIAEASQRLGVSIHAVRGRLYAGLFNRLEVRGFHRALYLTEASVRRQEILRAGLDTRAASRYLHKRGVQLSPKTLINRRYKGLAPKFKVDGRRQVVYPQRSLNAFIDTYKRNGR